MNHVNQTDVVVTQDIGLASTLLPKGVIVIHPRGDIFTEREIESALQMRYLSAKARRQGKHSKGPKPYRKEDRIKFEKNLIKILSKIAGDS